MNIHLVLNLVFIGTIVSFYQIHTKLIARNQYLEAYKYQLTQTFKVLEVEMKNIKEKIKTQDTSL
jgi:hypothetical protein